MERLTPIRCGREVINCKESYTQNQIQQMFLRLGKLEDIEEEIGIDLLTLFKAQTQGFYIINVSNKIEKVRLSEWRFNLIKKEVHRVKSSKHLPFINYGKTWALTKEELER